MIALVNGQGTVIQQQEFVSVHSEGFCRLLGQGICYPLQLRQS